jgi:hypothetical protein
MSTNNDTNIEGYPRLARVMGPRNLSLFRKFAELNAFNLLQLQAELVYLEQELKILHEIDHTSGHPTRTSHAKSAYTLRNSMGSGNDQQWQKILEIREKLKEYSKKFQLLICLFLRTRSSCPDRCCIITTIRT